MKIFQKKRIILTIIFTLCFSGLLVPIKTNALATFQVNVGAESAIVMEQSSGRVLFAKDEHTKRRIASITKIMTAILAIESGKLNDTVTVTESAVQTEGSSIFLQVGQKIKLEDLVYGLMLRSGNDAAKMIAEYVGGSFEGFVYMMNQKAEEVGMKNTNFMNPSGLDTSDEHYSTAYDMALLTRYSMHNETYRKITGTKYHRTPSADGKWDWNWKNKNKLLTTLYEYSTGGKTGFTKLARRTLVSTASKKGMDLISVTLNDSQDWEDHINLFNRSFKDFKMTKIIKKGKVEGVKEKHFKNSLYVESDFVYPLTEQEQKEVRLKIELLDQKKEWKKKMRSGEEVVGKIDVYVGEEVVGTRTIYYRGSLSSFLDQTKNLFSIMIGIH